jgi:hypothetical protein
MVDSIANIDFVWTEAKLETTRALSIASCRFLFSPLLLVDAGCDFL